MKIQFQFNEIRFEFNEIHSMRKASWVEHPGTRQSSSRHFSQQKWRKDFEILQIRWVNAHD